MTETLTIGDENTVPAVSKGKTPVQYSFEVAEALLIAVAEGKTLTEIAKQPDMPSRKTIYKWLTQYPKFFDAYERAKEVSAQSLEDEALTIARNLQGSNDYSGVKVTALNYAMQQLRWSAARRDPARYGQKAEAVTTIPIQINTSLNLGQEGQPPASDNHQSVYHVEAVVEVRPTDADTSDADDDPLTLEGELAPDADADETGVFEAPAEQTTDLKQRGKPGRPVGSRQGPHKSPRRAAATATRYANKKKEK